MNTQITPYIENSLDQEFQDIVTDALSEESFIAQQLSQVSSDLVAAGTNVTATQLEQIAERIAILSTNYEKLIQYQERIANIALSAAETGQSILGYTPDDIARQAELRKAAYATVAADFQNSLNIAVSQDEWLKLSSDLSRVASVFGQAVGLIIDAVSEILTTISKKAFI